MISSLRPRLFLCFSHAELPPQINALTLLVIVGCPQLGTVSANNDRLSGRRNKNTTITDLEQSLVKDWPTCCQTSQCLSTSQPRYTGQVILLTFFWRLMNKNASVRPSKLLSDRNPLELKCTSTVAVKTKKKESYFKM